MIKAAAWALALALFALPVGLFVFGTYTFFDALRDLNPTVAAMARGLLFVALGAYGVNVLVGVVEKRAR